MYDWDQYKGSRPSTYDDPWDRAAAPRPQKRPHRSAAPAGTSVQTDGGSSTVTYTAKPSRSARSKSKKVLLVLGIVLLVLVFTSLQISLNSDNLSHSVAPIPPDSKPHSEAPFDSEIEAVEASDFGPSFIERYSDPLDFSLTLSASDTTPLSYRDIYDKLIPSVVSILVYDEDGGACATGIVLSEDGCILTNQHVVAGAEEAEVITHDGKIYNALLVGDDENTDLALLKIDAEGLVPAQFAASSEIHVGDECFAIGNPMGMEYSGTFSNGIISAINRTVNMDGYTMTLLQTTTALNVGNSGGPLINAYGQVVGVVNMKLIDPESGIEGMGFAIPSTVAKRVTDTLAKEGKVEHPVLGITCYSVTAGAHEDALVDGLYVVSVAENSGAADAGLAPGDIITHLDGSPIHTVGDANLGSRHVGDTVSITVCRDGETFDLSLQLTEQNELN